MEPVKLLVPLKALLAGFKELLKTFPLKVNDSLLAIFTSPSQATNPIFELALSMIFKLLSVKLIEEGTPCKPS